VAPQWLLQERKARKEKKAQRLSKTNADTSTSTPSPRPLTPIQESTLSQISVIDLGPLHHPSVLSHGLVARRGDAKTVNRMLTRESSMPTLDERDSVIALPPSPPHPALPRPDDETEWSHPSHVGLPTQQLRHHEGDHPCRRRCVLS
jgi:hypothetical protein